jgi:hypothetical protein
MSDDKANNTYTDVVSDGAMDPRNKKELLEGLDELRESVQEAHAEYEAKNDAWWNGLTEEEREDAFYAVIKRMYKAEVVDRGTYRYALYDVFGFDPGMYGRGMDCGYLNLHNMIFDSFELSAMKNVTRFEVIDDKGRTYVKYLKDDEGIKYSLQDDDRTLKVFIDNLSWKGE